MARERLLSAIEARLPATQPGKSSNDIEMELRNSWTDYSVRDGLRLLHKQGRATWQWAGGHKLWVKEGAEAMSHAERTADIAKLNELLEKYGLSIRVDEEGK